MPCLTKSVDGVDRPGEIGDNIPSGRQTVNYRDAKGIRRDAVVIAPGTVSGLRLWLRGGVIVDNVGPMTSIKGTNVYDARH